MDRRRRTRPPAKRVNSDRFETGRIFDVRIDKVVAEGDGLGRDDTGKVVFVEGALPGELVSAKIVSESKDYARALTLEVREAHARRVAPPCPYVSTGCGGCDLQHADTDLQIEIKRDIVEESLRRLGGIELPDVRVRRSETLASSARTTVRVAAGERGVGFRRRHSHDVVPIETCLVGHRRINDVVSGLELAAGAEAVIRVSATTGDAIVWVEPREGLISCGDDVRVGADTSIEETIDGVTFRVSAASFFQSSPAAAETLVRSVRSALGPVNSWPEGTVIDAYGGVGLFAATVFPRTRHVVSIEASPISCADARINLADRDVDIVEGRVEDWVAEPAGIVVADPARDGLRRGAVDILTSSRPTLFVLVSCDPASLGRDAKLLGSAGYRLEYSEVLEVFAHTHHVETVSRFVRSVQQTAVEVP